MTNHSELLTKFETLLQTANLLTMTYPRGCAQLNVSIHVMRRAMNKHKTNFKKLRDNEQKRRFYNYMFISEDRTFPPTGTAIYRLLGFRDVEGFYRWHKRSFGYGFSVRYAEILRARTKQLKQLMSRSDDDV